jgi:hypothetical protein
VLLGCGNEVNNGLPTYGSAKLQGFVSQSDGTPLADTEVFASYGPDAFGLRARTDRRGLYEIQGVSRQPIDEPPFDDGLILSRLIVGRDWRIHSSLSSSRQPTRFPLQSR